MRNFVNMPIVNMLTNYPSLKVEIRNTYGTSDLSGYITA